ncbi:MAG: glycoside hydrolase family 88 protein [Culturomica sp.]|nr:glycoside hydrolase family 88 protein [Culturomica sp.]
MKRKRNYLLSLFVLLFFSCTQEEKIPWSVRMAESEIKRNPELWQVDFLKKPKWDYTQGLMAQALMATAETYGKQEFFDYTEQFARQFVDSTGAILTYKLEDYSLDRLNGGKFLWKMWRRSGEERYKAAALLLRSQLDAHPRTHEGGFWHKKIYPWQMWLDGLYMGAPFYAQCAGEQNRPEDFNDVIDQFTLVYRHTYDPRTGLNFHGWDESREQAWADPETGCSPHVWGRAVGWFFMALTDVLDFIPAEHPRRGEITELLVRVAEGVKNTREPASKVWYQVLDEPERAGNYLEASASSMFVYALLKAVRMGYLPADPYLTVAEESYQGVIRQFVRQEADGTVSLTRCCAVAGLGGNPYRDGSFEYYVGEKIRDNDPKGVGPFILASLEYEKMDINGEKSKP